MPDQEEPKKHDDIPAIVPKNPDQPKPEPDAQAPKGNFKSRVDRLATRFRRRPSFPWNTATNLFVAVVVTIGTVVGVLTLLSLNRSVDEMAKQTPEIIKSAKAAEDAAIAAKDAAAAAKIQAEASKTQ